MNEKIKEIFTKDKFKSNDFLSDRIDKLIDNEFRQIALSGFLSHIQNNGMFFLGNDSFNEARQNFYLCGKMYVVMCLMNDEKLIHNIHHLTFILLSDNQKLLDSLVKNYQVDDWEKKHSNLGGCVISILNNDWKQLTVLNSYTEDNLHKKGRDLAYIDINIFNGFIEKDENKIRDNILLLAGKYHKRRYKQLGSKECISIPALTYAKLAYIKGYELDIDHPLIPKEMLPVIPNMEYWEYDFMKEGVFKDV